MLHDFVLSLHIRAVRQTTNPERTGVLMAGGPSSLRRPLYNSAPEPARPIDDAISIVPSWFSSDEMGVEAVRHL